MSISPFLSIDSPCDKALQLAKQQLVTAGLRPVQTFDLHGARLIQQGCTCPNHGTDDCDCQMIILLVYGEVAEPATLILHGNNGKTWFSITNNPLHRIDEKLMTSLQQVLARLAVLTHRPNGLSDDP